ncbi:HAMP domain-containing sensor histidine kinase [Alkalimonas delamerensis]|uniref:histidine kinase n=1 Tax=Alkalimonas delamerensis TaxID=265981 RepID=A0ABT9GQ74_9GAMM|nr:HAMP domain-containing sensor histidine kinase [Alkalimonas delamerensis]MDP4529122.1 HAMP domain-containing sensor histidine kinase [Alkalimonas delamerensis]
MLSLTVLEPQHQLRQLARFRWGVIGFIALAMLAAWLLHYPVSSWPLLGLLLVLFAASNVLLPLLPNASQYSMRLYALYALADIVLLCCMLVLSGGVSNGLVALLLLPVAMASVLLPGRLCYLVALIAVLAYSLLMQLGDISALPIAGGWLELQPEHAAGAAHAHHGAGHGSFDQHLLQMWWAFALSAALISWFISAQARQIRKQARVLNQLQQQQLRQEQMLALATFAANAAHDLATPIQTMALIADELEVDAAQSDQLQDLQQQLQRCQHLVQQLRQDAGSLRQPQQAEPVLKLTEQTVQRWLASRPDIEADCQFDSQAADFLLSEPQSLAAALLNILDNAADAGLARQQPKLSISCQLNAQDCSIRIRDYGEGFSEQRLQELGHLPQLSSQGLGIGQFLANASIERLGGKVVRSNLADGALTCIELPRPRHD